MGIGSSSGVVSTEPMIREWDFVESGAHVARRHFLAGVAIDVHLRGVDAIPEPQNVISLDLAPVVRIGILGQFILAFIENDQAQGAMLAAGFFGVPVLDLLGSVVAKIGALVWSRRRSRSAILGGRRAATGEASERPNHESSRL